jgi:hypothetical protein
MSENDTFQQAIRRTWSISHFNKGQMDFELRREDLVVDQLPR